MSLTNGNVPIPVCPRCGVVHTQNEDICGQCGYRFASAQRGQHIPLPQLPSYQAVQPSQVAPLSLPISQGSRLLDCIYTLDASSHKRPRDLSHIRSQDQFTSAHQSKQEHVTLAQTGWSSSQMHLSAVHVSHGGWMPRPVQPSYGTVAQLSQPTPSSPQPDQAHQTTQSSSVPGKKDDPPGPESRRALVYFTTVFVAIMLLIFAVFHAAGMSLSAFTLTGSAVSTPTPYPVPRATPLLVDTFQNDSIGWNLQSVAGSYEVMLGNGKLELEDDTHSLLWELLPGMQTYSNFELRVDATLSKGDADNGYGVYIRCAPDKQSDLASYYRFELYGDGSYAIFKGEPGVGGMPTETRLTKYIVHPAIQKQGQLNHIIIIAKGTSLSFVVNNQLLTTIKDNSYMSGSVAFFVSNLPNARPGAQVQFSQFVIYPL